MNSSYDWPIGVRTVDISRPVESLTGLGTYSRVRLFVSSGQELIGLVDIWNRGADVLSAGRVREAIAERLGQTLYQRQLRTQLLAADPESAILPPTTISVVVPTCGRPDDLRRCLASVVAQKTRHTLDVVVVDNCPGNPTAAQVVGEFPSVRLVGERRPGLSFARNTGIKHAVGSIIVATDDDVTAPDTWIEKLVAPFARPEVAVVNGNVLPVELETEAQCRFEAYGGLGKGFAPFEVNGDWFRTQRGAVPTWSLGATANAAFRASVFADPRIGLLDEALGAGTPTGCSEDSYVYYKVLKAGHTITYEPSAFVWHRHRIAMANLRKQIFAYSKGHVAYHLTTLTNDGDRRALTRLFYALPVVYVKRALQRMRGHSDYPLSLIGLEILGNFAGPLALWRSRRRARRLGPSTPLAQERPHVLSMESPGTQGPAN
jgi:glycosyltransferase involved in cell wall biosynthesis